MPRVEIYTKAFCSYCFRAKRLFDSKGIAYEEHAVDFDVGAKRDMVQRTGGRSTVPQIFIDGRHVGGCEDLMQLERDGRIDEILAA